MTIKQHLVFAAGNFLAVNAIGAMWTAAGKPKFAAIAVGVHLAALAVAYPFMLRQLNQREKEFRRTIEEAQAEMESARENFRRHLASIPYNPLTDRPPSMH